MFPSHAVTQTLPLLHPSLAATAHLSIEAPTPGGPERILMFGTGALLRGLVVSVVNEARHAGVYDGAIVAVESTGTGRSEWLNRQGGWFTEEIAGIVDGQAAISLRINGAIRRAVSAQSWAEVVAAALNPSIQVIVSNTTEVGIRFEPDELTAQPPRTFPGKLTAVLAAVFAHDPGRRMAVLPCELVPDNGVALKQTVLQHAAAARLGRGFERWLDTHVAFCNTLVDRIVTGTPPAEVLANRWEKAGFRDEMYTVAEPYGLWAIECPAAFRDLIGFTSHPELTPVADDITPFRERKLRILNGTHTISVPLALLMGLRNVRSAMAHPLMGAYFERVATREIAPIVPAEGVQPFAAGVLDRFRNPFLDHKLEDIAFQSTAKMRMRNVASLLRYAAQHKGYPPLMALGFAALIRLLKPADPSEDRFVVEAAGYTFNLKDEGSAQMRAWWAEYTPGQEMQHVSRLLADTQLWGEDLNAVPGLAGAVAGYLPPLLDGQAGSLIEEVLKGTN